VCRTESELFPSSDTEYFVKQFYGEVAFHRDERGEVDYLDFVMKVPDSEPLCLKVSRCGFAA
jgi:hypothetical protein